ncbi:MULTISPECIES: EAL domain-containing protein [Methylobacterium]|uniref:putative bifunctional diguanylate cyclase/phosphodiesterase n=1 Tax=Methylobacterium TaxID=407 RepID=UPI0005BB6910|nr:MULTISPECIES: EAL domain-containing protein [Methylobacterium]MDE4911197.1 EAL domain-containing protein [Methylobacterium sp. 092160098-2]MDH3032610.1 EAL domain-containing protein [Methylobacterium fujisawaense]SFV12141.1 PAS domain S-box-containing protein/diguanylate cyclase (GGDEF) domain-containing protein [Methylobacterium sp. UNCCL125]
MNSGMGALREKAKLLDTVLDTMDQGLMMIDAAGVVQVCNARALTLLDLPPALMRTRPTFEAVRQYQIAQGEFGAACETLRRWVAARGLERRAHTYERERPNGTVLEIRTVPLPDGGAVRTFTDITARKRAEETLQVSETRLALAQDAGSDGLWDCDLTTGEAWSSDRWWGVLGYEPGELASHAQTWRALLHPEDAGAAERALIEHLSGRAPTFACEHRMRRKDGTWAWMMTRGKVVARAADGRALRFIGTQIDISARKAAEGQVAHMARHDGLTDLPNRALFYERLEIRLADLHLHGGACAVLCLDLDRFKAVNDSLGHAAGDFLLRAVAHRIRAVLRAEDMVARLGGDEFAVLVADAGDPAHAETLAARLIAAVQAPIRFGKQRLKVGLSVGIAQAPGHGPDSETLFRRADLALCRAKAEGGNTHRVFEPTMDEAEAARRDLERDLRQAIEGDELILHYQPQVSTATGRLVGFEALVRWEHPTRGLVPPNAFIPLAEESDLILLLGEWVLRAASREAARWSRPLKVAVNLSPRQFQQADLPERILAILTETGLAPTRLELEITETLIINDMARALGILRRLKAFGISIAMDDFGTGYSSLATLQAFPFDKIKIDRSFVGHVEVSAQAAVIVRAVLGLGRSLGMSVVAEGVETDAQMRFLAAEACDEAQGYLISKPQPIEHFAEQIGACEGFVAPGRPDAAVA